jgi:hypothetical protein
MAEVIVIEFESPQAVRIYNEVNKIIGWEGAPGDESWPAGMISHVAAEAGDKLIVIEAWDSQADEERFMQSTLAPAFAQANVPPPTRVEWFSGVMNVHR